MFATFIDSLIERLILPSFSSIGPAIRSRLFGWKRLEDYSLNGKVVVLTGATSGIGQEAAYIYARLGATLVIVGRNRSKTDSLVSDIIKVTKNTDIHSSVGDLGVLDQVREVANDIGQRFPRIDILVHNAGALFNVRQRTPAGTDLTVELMVSSPFLLTGLLLPQLAQATNTQAQNSPARVITMSSGGMYTEPLTVDGLEMSDQHYQGAQQYARAKRAQVILNKMWASRISANKIVFHALHPGWVNTPGISEALPRFSTLLIRTGLLRKPPDGADTMVWLSVDELPSHSSGMFWHDRKIRNIDITKKSLEADTQETREALWEWCEVQTGWSFKPQD